MTKYGFSINLIVKIMEGQGDHFENICQKVMTGKRSQKISLLVFKDNHNETQLLHYITYLPTCYFALFMGEVFYSFQTECTLLPPLRRVSTDLRLLEMIR